MNFPPVPFKVVGIDNFNVVPIVKGKVYTITEVSEDGVKWKTNGPDDKSGWFPKQMCSPIQTNRVPQGAQQTQQPKGAQARVAVQPRHAEASQPPSKAPQQQQQQAKAVQPAAQGGRQAAPVQTAAPDQVKLKTEINNMSVDDILDSLQFKAWDDL